MQINRSRNTENSSGYSSIKTSPQSSDEDLWASYSSYPSIFEKKHFRVNARWNKIRLELKPRNPLLINAETEEASTESDDADIRDDAIKETTEIDGELEGDFRPVWTPNELDPHREWYDKLLTFTIEYQQGERGAFPPFPPPPLPSALIAASEATSYNSFDAVKQAATVLSVRYLHSAMSADANSRSKSFSRKLQLPCHWRFVHTDSVPLIFNHFPLRTSTSKW